MLCIVATVEPLASSARGKRNPFSEVLAKFAKPPNLVLFCKIVICIVVIVVVEVVFFRGLLDVPLSILLVCIIL
ncbi:uncharacterized [Tachysurus ichikawai]